MDFEWVVCSAVLILVPFKSNIYSFEGFHFLGSRTSYASNGPFSKDKPVGGNNGFFFFKEKIVGVSISSGD